ncbi:LysR family transcriptional regulator [Flagellimonas sp. DF-77]|uniref:LysR family transcriptional regulator n=1 Tax=Flagellimonas algarum TaxID=3230298 RepID=UPI003395843E
MDYQIELRHLRYFLAVAELLHFRKAAEKLFISQPGLSTQIRQLEETIGVRLFVRDKKKVRMTPAGEHLKKEAEFVVNHLNQTMRQLKLIEAGDQGELRIGFLGSAMQQVVPELLLDLQNRHQGIHTSLDELSNRAQVDGIANDRLDLGFVRLTTVPKGLRIQPVFEDTFSLVLPADHHCSASRFKGMQEVAEEDFILFSQDYSPLYYDTVISICQDAGFAPRVSHQSVHAQTIFKLVANKLGIAIVPSALQFGFQMDVKFIDLDTIPQRAVLSMIWKEDNRNPVLQHALRSLEDAAKRRKA